MGTVVQPMAANKDANVSLVIVFGLTLATYPGGAIKILENFL